MKRKPGSSRLPKDLRARAEALLSKKRRDTARMPEQGAQKLVHELQVHQIELEMQNDELRRSQLELGEARDRYSDLYDFAPGALLALSQRGEVLEANLAASALLGVERKKLLRQKLARFIPAEAQDTFYLYCREVLHSGAKQTCELALKSATGRRLTVRLEGIAAEDPATHKTQCRLSLNDITESKQAEAALVAVNTRLDGIISSAMDAIISVDSRQRVVLFNQAAEKMFGMTAQEALGQSLGRFIPARYRAAHARHVSQYGETGVSSRSMGRLGALLGLRANGEEFPIEASISQITVQGEKLFTVILRDATERKRLDETLRQLNVELEQRVAERTAEVRENEARYRSLVTASAQIIWTTNPQGQVLEDIPTWRAFTGQSYDQTKGWGWASALHPDDLERTKTVWQHSVATRSSYEIEYRVRRNDGEYRYFAARGVPIIQDDGSVREWVGACTDITERKAARERREATNALLALFARKSSSSEYLAGVIEVIRSWTDCQGLGIRVADEHGAVPYGASMGFDAEFLQKENGLSLKTDTCCCIRAMSQVIEEQDRPLLTPGGSMRCDNTVEFVSQLSPQQQARYRGNCVSAGFVSVAVIPIRYHDRILGAIHLADRRPARFPLAKVEFLESMTPLIGEALHRFQAEAELAKHRGRLEELVKQRTGELEGANEQLRKEIVHRKQAEGRTTALARLGLLLSAAHEPAVAARALLDTALEFCGWDACFLLMHDPVTDTATGLVNMDMIDGRRVPVPALLPGRRPTPLIRRVLQEGPQLILRKNAEDMGPITTRFGDTSRLSLSLMYVPVRLENRSIGVLSVQSYQRNAYTPQDLEVLQGLADHGAGALARVQAEVALHRLNEELERRTRELEAANEQLRKEIASRQAAEQALLGTAEDLKRSNLDLEQFGYVASHDLQEPLRAVAGYVRLLEHRFPEKVDAKTREYIDGAAEGATRMERLITDLMTFSRLSTEGRPFTPVNLDVSLNAALRTLQFSIRAAHAVVTHDPLPTLPADESQIVQLFQNLIANALKFRGEHPPQIHIGARPEEGRCVFRVRDNGIGIDPQYFERVFQVFQRLHTRKKYPGTGIGLAICKKIVERHGGKIWVESQPGRGSTFYFSISAATTR